MCVPPDGEWADLASEDAADGACLWARVEVGESVVHPSCERSDETPCELRS